MAEHKCDKLEMVQYLSAQWSSSRCQPAGLQALCLSTCSSPEPWSENAVRGGRRRGCRGAGMCVHSVCETSVFPMKASIVAAFYGHMASQDFNLHHGSSNIKKQSFNGGLKFWVN